LTNEIIILGDIHAGVRNGNLIVAKHQLDFFEFELFPYMLEHGIKTIVQLGDLFDGRKFTNHVVLNEWKTRFFQKMVDHGFEFHSILGNHDLSLRNSLTINTPSLFLNEYDNITIYDSPSVFKYNDFEMLLVPWMCVENYNQCITTLNETKCTWVGGHFEIQNFEMHKGHMNTEGLDPGIFNKFDTVLSGHFHTRSRGNHICYVGTPYELTWSDFDDPKGFHVLNAETLDLTFIENKLKLFEKIYYNDLDAGDDYFKTIDLKCIEGKYVKVVAINKTDPYQFDRFMSNVYTKDVIELKIIEDMGGFDSSNVDDDDIILTDTPAVINSYIEGISTSLDIQRLKDFMKELYVESLSILE
jgi:DNA repair exonuclease SbcCD nuclease subunit